MTTVNAESGRRANRSESGGQDSITVVVLIGRCRADSFSAEEYVDECRAAETLPPDEARADSMANRLKSSISLFLASVRGRPAYR